MNNFQVAVVGAGISGLTAACKAAAEGLSVIHFIDPDALRGGLVANVGELRGIPWARSLAGMDLANQLAEAGAVLGVQLVSLRPDTLMPRANKFQLRSGDRSWTSNQVILATGARLRDIDIPGAREFKDNGVLNCAWCNAGLFRQRPVVVIGGGNSALQEAMHLARYASTVTVVTHSAELNASRQSVREAAKLKNIEFRWDAEALAVVGSKGVEGLSVRHKQSGRQELLKADGIFVFIGLAANAALARGLTQLDEAGYLKTNERFETSCPGLYAIGAVRSGYSGAIVAAMGEATSAALAAAARAA